jgi:hypothetical protein
MIYASFPMSPQILSEFDAFDKKKSDIAKSKLGNLANWHLMHVLVQFVGCQAQVVTRRGDEVASEVLSA